ncbi:hypothetical protein B296_00058971 [Ensete ventricosum]|uniref:Uncharacterized protein n=1 Tax=Ensete ventricosum TaxID=4639 RepID=A0A426X517_ENSVE|nr:hypothetical protein B296_00058971 [Ensete ventricosum]
MAMAEERYNRRNPAVKRILQEVKEMQCNPSDDFMSLPLEVIDICTYLTCKVLLNQIHQYMLSKASPVPQFLPTPTTEPTDNLVPEDQVTANLDAISAAEDLPNQESDQRAIEDGHEVHVNEAEGPLRVGISAGASSRLPAVEVSELHQRPAARVQKPLDDRFLTWAAIWLVVAILLLLVKKFLKFNSFAGYMGGL